MDAVTWRGASNHVVIGWVHVSILHKRRVYFWGGQLTKGLGCFKWGAKALIQRSSTEFSGVKIHDECGPEGFMVYISQHSPPWNS